ncbi:MAG: formylglycine-generating enzyme family protein [Pirellulaceae bacterium]
MTRRRVVGIALLLLGQVMGCDQSPPGADTTTPATAAEKARRDKEAVLAMLRSVPTSGLPSEEVIQRAGPHLAALLLLTKDDCHGDDLYPALALTAGLCQQAEHRQYAVAHFGEIPHPDIQLSWAVHLFNQGAASPEIVTFLSAALQSKEQSQLIALIVWPNIADFKVRVNQQAAALDASDSVAGSSNAGQTVAFPEMVRITAGTIQMGSPATEEGRDTDETMKEVALSKDFYLGKYEVTVGQFRRFVEDTGYRTEHEREGDDYDWRRPFKNLRQGDDHPVLAVSWHDATAYCEWLSKQTGQSYRLPTESEWEYACRAGTTTAFNVGNTLTKQDANFANWEGSTEGLAALSATPLGTTSVGSYKPNAFGLYDMHGNVFEWCSDYYGDAVGDNSGERYHVVRGGS